MNSALLIIDMISPFDFPEAASMQADLVRTARQIRRLREACHRSGRPVIYANDNFAHWRSDFRELVAMASASGETAKAVVACLKPTPEDYFILKPKHSAFLATPLPVLLSKLGVDTLFLTGMTADACILSTAVDANAREYRVRVVREAVAALPERKRWAFSLMSASHAAQVVGVRTAMNCLGHAHADAS
ncbi:cysteine hydrolase [Stenotrophomonas sp. HITSZ_GD]|uniref:cysteine hydrolase family protein n=1 Tax=Stenotrophomonas sp. HITSZ_GD TaxID=3037248 RepID=UPI00240D00AC|nr:isochorismatase family cysteine hydrolase [Stenotrophomonas sp. HITSZ_GD]MDG2525926.1 cysteine hydrolase [Stenotrophomonas sp. HITSZ_GD]